MEGEERTKHSERNTSEEQSLGIENTEKRSLNVGCGKDTWGDVRLDSTRTYLGHLNSANIYGDAQNLPFRENSFTELKAKTSLSTFPDGEMQSGMVPSIKAAILRRPDE